MLAIIENGEPFNCTYLKSDGEITSFVGIRKYVRKSEEEPAQASEPATKRASRNLQKYLSLIPFLLRDEQGLRELYTRKILSFNQTEVIL